MWLLGCVFVRFCGYVFVLSCGRAVGGVRVCLLECVVVSMRVCVVPHGCIVVWLCGWAVGSFSSSLVVLLYGFSFSKLCARVAGHLLVCFVVWHCGRLLCGVELWLRRVRG